MVELLRPTSLKEAFRHIEGGDKIILAGGTDLMVRRKKWSGVTPGFDKTTVFVGGIPELRRLEYDSENIIIGAGCTFADLIESDFMAEIIKDAALNTASPAIRNIATIGGNICNASPAADILPPLYAHEAMLIVESSNSTRQLPVENFIKGPGKTDLRPNEILTKIIIPKRTFNRVMYKKVGTRKATALAKLSFAALAQVEDDCIKDIRIAFGAVAPTVVKSSDIESSLKGAQKEQAVRMLPEILEGYSKIINPIDDQRSTAAYRKRVSLNFVEDFIKNNL